MRAAFPLLGIILSLLATNTFAQSRPPLLRDAVPGDDEPHRGRGAIRSRFVKPDLAPLAFPELRPGQRVAVEREFMANFFDDAWLPVRIESMERDLTGSYVATGRIAGQPGSSVTIAVHDDAMSAVFSTLQRLYEIRPGRKGTHQAIESDGRKYPNELMPIAVNLLPQARAKAITQADSGATIDVGVVYTSAAVAWYGSAATVQALISDAIAAANTAYANSSVTPRLRLVGTLLVNYDDTTKSFSQILTELANPTDLKIDEVHAWRTQVGADAVSMIVANPTDASCGLGYLMSGAPSSDFAPYAFNVVLGDCAVGNFSLAHELGHNFGLAHDHANAGSSPPSYPYAFGYQDPAGAFRTIMAYPNGCQTQTLPCPRVQYFSNPTKLYNGAPMGIDQNLANPADAVRALNNNASIVANWRTSVLVVPSVSFTDDPLAAGTTTIKAVHLTELRSAVDAFRAAAGLTSVTWTDSASAGLVVKAVHIQELRDNLAPALTVFGRTVTYTNPTISSGMTVKAVDLQEIRNAMK